MSREPTDCAYSVLVCPVCAEQMEPPSYEYGPDTHEHDGVFYEPIEIAAELDQTAYVSTAGLTRFQKQDEIRETAFRKAEQSWFRSLDEGERERAETERRRYLSPLALLLEDNMKAMAQESLLDTKRQLFRQTNG